MRKRFAILVGTQVGSLSREAIGQCWQFIARIHRSRSRAKPKIELIQLIDF